MAIAALALAATACGDDDEPAQSAATSTTAAPASTAEATTTTGTDPPTGGPVSEPSDGSTMDRPTIGRSRALAPGDDACDLVDPAVIAATAFGDVGTPDAMSDTVPGSDGCLVPGINHGEITFAVAPLSEFDGTPSPDGTWELIGGNTAYVFCTDDDEGIDEQACAAFVALDDETMLSVFVFLPTNSLDQLGDATRRITTHLLDGLPAA